MKIFLTCLSAIFSFVLQAQNLSVTAFGGYSNYKGDLQEKNFTATKAHPAYGAGLLYELSNKLSARANFTTGKISAADKDGSKNQNRNLSFSSPITDIHLGAEYNLFNIYERGFTPYVFAGISYFHFNPSALDTSGKEVFLQPLGTEGQGFYAGRKKYSLNQFSLPFGAGAKLALGDNIRVGFEVGFRKTLTDYLDDVSTTYADKNLLTINNGQRSAELAFRGDELKGTVRTYPPAGEQRGQPKFKDWYYFTGLSLSFRLGANAGNGSNKGKAKTGCPGTVY